MTWDSPSACPPLRTKARAVAVGLSPPQLQQIDTRCRQSGWFKNMSREKRRNLCLYFTCRFAMIEMEVVFQRAICVGLSTAGGTLLNELLQTKWSRSLISLLTERETVQQLSAGYVKITESLESFLSFLNCCKELKCSYEQHILYKNSPVVRGCYLIDYFGDLALKFHLGLRTYSIRFFVMLGSLQLPIVFFWRWTSQSDDYPSHY